MSFLGWLDFSEMHRKKVQMVMSLFKEQGVVDELGIGTIRDALSDLLFPGTSVAQTRAKYFLLIPYFFKEIESRQRFYGRDFIQELERQEKGLIQCFKPFKRGDGVIGKRNGNPIQKPSSIYWNGLRTYNILRFPGTLSNYAYYIEHLHAKPHKQKLQQLTDNGNIKGDDRDASFLYDKYLWSQVPPVEKDWKEKLSIDLTCTEAEFLREKIITSCPDSLFAFTLNHLSAKAIDYISIDDYLEEPTLPDHFREVIELAVNFNFIMSGALIRYNYLIQHLRHEGNTTQTMQVWKKFLADKNDFDWESWDIKRLWDLCPNTTLGTRSFVERWIGMLKEDRYNESVSDSLLKEREYRLKGPKRSRLYDSAIAQKQEAWTGIEVDEAGGVYYLAFRWPTVRTLIKDIVKGLKTNAATQ